MSAFVEYWDSARVAEWMPHYIRLHDFHQMISDEVHLYQSFLDRDLGPSAKRIRRVKLAWSLTNSEPLTFIREAIGLPSHPNPGEQQLGHQLLFPVPTLTCRLTTVDYELNRRVYPFSLSTDEGRCRIVFSSSTAAIKNVASAMLQGWEEVADFSQIPINEDSASADSLGSVVQGEPLAEISLSEAVELCKTLSALQQHLDTIALQLLEEIRRVDLFYRKQSLRTCSAAAVSIDAAKGYCMMTSRDILLHKAAFRDVFRSLETLQQFCEHNHMAVIHSLKQIIPREFSSCVRIESEGDEEERISSLGFAVPQHGGLQLLKGDLIDAYRYSFLTPHMSRDDKNVQTATENFAAQPIFDDTSWNENGPGLHVGSRSEAIRQLQAGFDANGASQWIVTFGLDVRGFLIAVQVSFLVGCITALVLLTAGEYYSNEQPTVGQVGFAWYYMSASFTILLFQLLFSVCIIVFELTGVNYVFMLRVDPRRPWHGVAMLRDSLAYFLVWFCFCYGFVKQAGRESSETSMNERSLDSCLTIQFSLNVSVSRLRCAFQTEILPTAYLIPYILAVTLLVIFVAVQVLRRRELWLIPTLCRVVVTPYHPVRFADFIVCAMLVTLSRIWFETQFIWCTFPSAQDPSMAEYCGQGRMLRIMILPAVPVVWRLLQCLRNYASQTKKTYFPHVVHAVKYGFVLLALLGNFCRGLSIWSEKGYGNDDLRPTETAQVALLALYFIFRSLDSTFRSLWDVFVDVGLWNTSGDHSANVEFQELQDYSSKPCWVFRNRLFTDAFYFFLWW